jgi:hypothetical protein
VHNANSDDDGLDQSLRSSSLNLTTVTLCRVFRSTGDRPCAIPSSSRNPLAAGRDIFSHGKRVCISLVSRLAIFASAGSITRDPRAIAGVGEDEGEEDRQFQRTGIPVPPSERSRPDGLIVEQRWLGDGIISRADAAACTCPVACIDVTSS